MEKAEILAILLVFLAHPNVYANSVNVISEGNTSTTVNIQNSVNSTNETTSTQNCNTNIHVENNGQTKDYNSTNCGSIDVEANNGTSSIKVNGENVAQNNENGASKTASTPTNSLKPTDNATKEAEVKNSKEQTKNLDNSQTQRLHRFFESIRDFFKNLFFFIF